MAGSLGEGGSSGRARRPRRQALSTRALTLVLAVLAVRLAGCSDGRSCTRLADGRCVQETFRNPPVLEPDANGVYQLELGPTEFFHCHKLTHEDHGMMELVHVCDPGEEECDTLCDGGPCAWNVCASDDDDCKRRLLATKCLFSPEYCSEAALRCRTCGEGEPCPDGGTCADTSSDGVARCVPSAEVIATATPARRPSRALERHRHVPALRPPPAGTTSSPAPKGEPAGRFATRPVAGEWTVSS